MNAAGDVASQLDQIAAAFGHAAIAAIRIHNELPNNRATMRYSGRQ
jgi:thioredoxin reductase